MPPSSTDGYFKTLNLVFLAMFGGNVVFFVVVLYLVRVAGYPTQPELHGITLYAVPILSGAIAMAATLLHQRMIGSGQRLHSLTLKRQRYQMATVLYCAVLNGASTFCLVVFLLVGSDWYLVFFAALLGLFLLRRPSRQAFIRDLALSREEAQRVEGYGHNG
ncbi:MAG: hypothetical protein SFY70_09685 [Bacteroidia bacterium]|nr:hypothetical protein [Bacteroidia bacterium]